MRRVSPEDRPVQAGTVVYAAAGVEHHFHTITKEPTILVFFSAAPPVPAVTGADTPVR